jgi:hypothetical protein
VAFSGSLKISLGCLLSVFHEREREKERERERERERGGNAGGAYLFVVLHCFSIFCEVVEGRNCVCVLACVFVCHVVASVAR